MANDTRGERLHTLLSDALAPTFLQVINESHQHSGPATESHYKVVIASPVFAGLRAVARHQRVYALVAAEQASGMHALALHTYTPEEWAVTESAPDSPLCRGGSQHV